MLRILRYSIQIFNLEYKYSIFNTEQIECQLVSKAPKGSFTHDQDLFWSSPWWCLTFLCCLDVLPFTADIGRHLSTWNITLCASALFLFLRSLRVCLHLGIGGGGGFDVFTDPTTLSTCDILPPRPDPRGHGHTERIQTVTSPQSPTDILCFACWVLILLLFVCQHKPRFTVLCFPLPSKKKPHCVCSLTFLLHFDLSPDKCLMKCCDCRIDYFLLIWHFLPVCLVPSFSSDVVRLVLRNFVGEWTLSKLTQHLFPFTKKSCHNHLSLSFSHPQSPQLPGGEPLLLVLSVVSSLQWSQ